MIQNQNNIEPNSFLAPIKSSPCVVRFIYLSVIITKIADIASNGWVQSHLVMDRNKVITQYQVWRVITSWFYEPNVFVLAMALISLWPVLFKFQKRNSSPVLLNDFLVNLYAFAVVFYLFQIVLWLLLAPNLPEYTYSIACMWINIIYKYCYYNSSLETTLFCSLKIKILYYPFILVLLICIAEMGIRYDAIFGLALSIIECQFFNGGMILFIVQTYQDKEKYVECLGVNRFQCWHQLNPDKIQINHRCTVNSSQFYINLASYEPSSIRIGQEQMVENTFQQSSELPTKIDEAQKTFSS